MSTFEQEQLVFVIGAPRSGTTLLMRMLAAHPSVLGRPEPHLLTPLARLGFYGRVQQAPYDALQAQQAVRAFVDDLPGGEATYLDALRAYTDALYEPMMRSAGATRFVDKTPAYALEMPFITRLYPRARYVVLLRHPFAIMSSYAESFFDGDWEAAHRHNPILERYLPALAAFLREPSVDIHTVRYESLVDDPEAHAHELCAFMGVEHDLSIVEYGDVVVPKGFGDPVHASRLSRPVAGRADRWALEVKGRPDRIRLLDRAIQRVDDDDLAQLGFDRERLWIPLETVSVDEAERQQRKARRWDRHHVERRVLTRARTWLRGRRMARWMRASMTLGDVLLRDGWDVNCDAVGRETS